MTKLNRKIVAVVMGAVLLMSILAGWRSFLWGNAKQKQDQQVLIDSQLSLARYSLDTQITDLSRQLVHQIEREEAGIHDKVSDHSFRLREDLETFLAVAWLESGSSTSWLAIQPQLENKLNLDQFEKYKSKLPLSLAQGNIVAWARLTEDNERPLFAMMIEVEKKGSSEESKGSKGIAVGIVSPEIFHEVGSFYKTQGQEFLLLDKKGVAFAYSSLQYVGAPIGNHPVVANVLAQDSGTGSGEEKDLSGQPALFSYEKLSNSNLYVILISSLHPLKQMVPHYLYYFLSLMGMGLGLALLAGTFVYVLLRREEGKNLQMDDRHDHAITENNTPTASRETRAIDGAVDREKTSRNSSVGESHSHQSSVLSLNLHTDPSSFKNHENQVDKGQVLREVGTGLVESLRPSLSAILGHAQLARTKSGEDDQLKQHYIVIERESRRLRDVLENLENLVKEEKAEVVQWDLQELVLSVLASQRAHLSRQGIQLKKSLHATGLVFLAIKRFRFVIEELLKNAVDATMALEAHPSQLESREKEIEVMTEIRGEKICLIVKDHGEGIESQNLGKVFDPFFTTYGNEERPGLGLTIVKRIVTSMQGTISISSQRGQGTTVTVEIPLATAEKKSEIKDTSLSEKVFSPSEPIVPVSLQRELEENFSLLHTKVVSGSGADHLPSPPKEDEITFVGHPLDLHEDESEEEVEIEKWRMQTHEKINDKNPHEDIEVKIRSPKVKG